jgi:hypothetical protein
MQTPHLCKKRGLHRQFQDPRICNTRSETARPRSPPTPHGLLKGDGTRFSRDGASRAQQVHRIIEPGVPRDMSRSRDTDGAEMQDAGWWSMIFGVGYFCASRVDSGGRCMVEG